MVVRVLKGPFKRNMNRRKKLIKKTSASRVKRLINLMTGNGRYGMIKGGPKYGFPDKLRVRLKYATSGTITSTTGSVGKQVFRANSIFDPDLTNAGHQPLYHDTFSSIYNHYSVIGSKIIIKLVNTSTNTFQVVLILDDDATTSTTLDTLTEQGHSRVRLLTPISGSRSSISLVGKWSARKVLGINPFNRDSQQAAAFGANPTEISTWTIAASDLAGGTNSITYQVVILYDVLLSELQTPVQS